MANSTNTYRVWQIVFYPESCPENYQEIIYKWHVPCLLSPLHNPANNSNQIGEEEKKIHYHLNLYFDGKKSYDQVLELALELNTKRLINIKSVRGMTRYLIHFDSPEKEQFDIESLVPFSGVSYIDYFIKDYNGVDCCEQLEDYIFKNRIDNMGSLINSLRSEDLEDLLNYVRFKNSFYIGKLLDGVYHLNRRGEVINEDEPITD